MEAFSARQPTSNLFGFVSTGVVQDQVNVQIGIDRLIDLTHRRCGLRSRKYRLAVLFCGLTKLCLIQPLRFAKNETVGVRR